MRAEEQVYFRSDRTGRLLIVVFCLAPMVVPALAIGFKLGFGDIQLPLLSLPASIASSAQASAPEPRAITLGTLPSRDVFHSAVFAAPNDPPQFFEPSGGETVVQRQVASSQMVSGTHVLRNVEARDGLSLASDAMLVRLEGVEPVPEGSECRRLDGVVEPCAQRAQNRLDVLTRGRAVTCDLYADDAGDMRGSCRAGKIDLAEDLLRNGLALRRAQ